MGSVCNLDDHCAFSKPLKPDEARDFYFVSRSDIYLRTTNTHEQLDLAMANIQRQIDEVTQNGSGWSVQHIQKLDIYTNKYKALQGNTHCKLPPELASKHAIINVKNKDAKCFFWSILAAVTKVGKDAQRLSKYQKFDNAKELQQLGLDFSGITYPAYVDEITTFENQNTHIGINVLGYGERGLFPLHSTRNRGENVTIINLLLLRPIDKPWHYCWIKDLAKFLFTTTKYEHRKFICNYCLCAFNNDKRLKEHQEFCTEGHQRVKMPDEPILKFKNHHRKVRNLFNF